MLYTIHISIGSVDSQFRCFLSPRQDQFYQFFNTDSYCYSDERNYLICFKLMLIKHIYKIDWVICRTDNLPACQPWNYLLKNWDFHKQNWDFLVITRIKKEAISHKNIGKRGGKYGERGKSGRRRKFYLHTSKVKKIAQNWMLYLR